MPGLEALEEQWRQHPPVHLLVAAYLQYRSADQPAADADSASAPSGPPAWQQGMGAVPASQAVRDAVTPEQAIKAFEHMFFGEVKDARQL